MRGSVRQEHPIQSFWALNLQWKKEKRPCSDIQQKFSKPLQSASSEAAYAGAMDEENTIPVL